MAGIDESSNLYNVLGIELNGRNPEQITLKDIIDAYKRKTGEYQEAKIQYIQTMTEQNPDADAKTTALQISYPAREAFREDFKKVSDAFVTLMNSEKREALDAEIRQQQIQTSFVARISSRKTPTTPLLSFEDLIGELIEAGGIKDPDGSIIKLARIEDSELRYKAIHMMLSSCQEKTTKASVHQKIEKKVEALTEQMVSLDTRRDELVKNIPSTALKIFEPLVRYDERYNEHGESTALSAQEITSYQRLVEGGKIDEAVAAMDKRLQAKNLVLAEGIKI